MLVNKFSSSSPFRWRWSLSPQSSGLYRDLSPNYSCDTGWGPSLVFPDTDWPSQPSLSCTWWKTDPTGVTITQVNKLSTKNQHYYWCCLRKIIKNYFDFSCIGKWNVFLLLSKATIDIIKVAIYSGALFTKSTDSICYTWGLQTI